LNPNKKERGNLTKKKGVTGTGGKKWGSEGGEKKGIIFKLGKGRGK